MAKEVSISLISNVINVMGMVTSNLSAPKICAMIEEKRLTLQREKRRRRKSCLSMAYHKDTFRRVVLGF